MSTSRFRHALVSVGLLGALLACESALEDSRQRVDQPRVLALRMSPAEARPGETVVLTALVAGGDDENLRLRWRFCGLRRPLATTGPYAPGCLDLALEDDRIEPLTAAPVQAQEGVRWTIPRDACRRFGPEPPPRDPSGVSGRPVDPDGTGGFHLPVRVDIEGTGSPVLSGVRVNCAPASATPEVAARYRGLYTPNANPFLRSVRWGGDQGASGVISERQQVLVAQPGERIVVVVGWPDCPVEDRCGDGVCTPGEDATSCPEDCAPLRSTCRGAERYLRFDPVDRELVAERESMRVTYFATGGRWDEYALGQEAASLDTEVQNLWNAPLEAGEGFLWIVLRDARGGVDWARLPWKVP